MQIGHFGEELIVDAAVDVVVFEWSTPGIQRQEGLALGFNLHRHERLLLDVANAKLPLRAPGGRADWPFQR